MLNIIVWSWIRDVDDYVTFAGIVSREYVKLQLKSLTEDQFKCLIFIAGLQSPYDADISDTVFVSTPTRQGHNGESDDDRMSTLNQIQAGFAYFETVY